MSDGKEAGPGRVILFWMVLITGMFSWDASDRGRRIENELKEIKEIARSNRECQKGEGQGSRGNGKDIEGK